MDIVIASVLIWLVAIVIGLLVGLLLVTIKKRSGGLYVSAQGLNAKLQKVLDPDVSPWVIRIDPPSTLVVEMAKSAWDELPRETQIACAVAILDFAEDSLVRVYLQPTVWQDQQPIDSDS